MTQQSTLRYDGLIQAQDFIEDVLCRVHIAVQNEITIRTIMNANTQVFLDYFTTTRAYLTGIPRVYLRYCSASFFRFADQDVDEGIPRSVSDAFSKVAVLQETLSVKIFHSDEVIPFHKVSGNVVGGITALIGDVLMKSLEFQNSFTPTIRAFLSASYLALKSFELPLGLAQIFGRSEELTIRSSYQIANTHVKTHERSCWLKKFRDVFHRKAGVISTSLPFDYCCLDDAVNRAMQPDLDVANMLDIQGFAFDSDAVIVGKLHRVKPVTSFESWVSRCFTGFHSTKERPKCFVQSAESALTGTEVGLLVIFVRFSGYLVRSGLLAVGNRFFAFFPGGLSSSKGVIIDMSVRLKRSFNCLNLFVVWIQSVFVCFQHWLYAFLGFDVFSDSFGRYVSCCTHIVTACPQRRQSAFKFREFMSKLVTGEPLDTVHNLFRSYIWWKRGEQVDVIRPYNQIDNLATEFLHFFRHKFHQPVTDISAQNSSAKLGTPDEVVVDIVPCMSSSFYHNKLIIT